MTRLDDFQTFAHWHVLSGDIDPVYPVLSHLIDELAPGTNDAVALVLLYVAYYNLPSALTVWMDGWREGDLLTAAEIRLPTGTERRAHRSPAKFQAHMASLRDLSERFGSLAAYLRTDHTDKTVRWRVIQDRLAAIRGNGRWAGYKTGEIFDTVLGWRCPPPDAGHAFSSGPRKGLADLFPETADLTGQDPATIRHLDDLTDRLVADLGLPVAQVETVLCDFHSAVKGGYYVGHDIDLLLDQTFRCQSEEARKLLFAARAEVFDRNWLGEFNGWSRVRTPLNSLYRNTGRWDWWA